MEKFTTKHWVQASSTEDCQYSSYYTMMYTLYSVLQHINNICYILKTEKIILKIAFQYK